MKILALEFSAVERSVAVATQDAGSDIKILALVKETSREVTGLSLIDRAMREAQLKSEEITDLIVGLGPGSYTGIRSAIALAQGWQLGREVRVTGISSVLCLAHQAHALGMRGDHSFIVDAQRGDVYHQLFRLDGRTATQLSDLRIISGEAARKLPNLIGPDARKFSPSAFELPPSAEFHARLHKLTPALPAEQLAPIYLRETAFVKAPTPRLID
jgi:tRNA threonylcarbamoyl adenosine modification protein YeaZ